MEIRHRDEIQLLQWLRHLFRFQQEPWQANDKWLTWLKGKGSKVTSSKELRRALRWDVFDCATEANIGSWLRKTWSNCLGVATAISWPSSDHWSWQELFKDRNVTGRSVEQAPFVCESSSSSIIAVNSRILSKSCTLTLRSKAESHKLLRLQDIIARPKMWILYWFFQYRNDQMAWMQSIEGKKDWIINYFSCLDIRS